MIAASVVSHRHGHFVEPLVRQLLGFPEISQILVTINVPEKIDLPDDTRITVIENAAPKGFGANHNAAFRQCRQRFFCVLNPDLSCEDNPFPELLGRLDGTSAALAAPLVIEPGGKMADSMRHFPTPADLVRKALGRGDGRHEVPPDHGLMDPDFVAGMFMLFRSAQYEAVGGFDEGFFMYYEDVDICARLWKSGQRVIGCPQARVIHYAQRASHRDLRHARWHIASMLRFWGKHLGRFPVHSSGVASGAGEREPQRSELV